MRIKIYTFCNEEDRDPGDTEQCYTIGAGWRTDSGLGSGFFHAAHVTKERGRVAGDLVFPEQARFEWRGSMTSLLALVKREGRWLPLAADKRFTFWRY
jgi:hypothetical protein